MSDHMHVYYLVKTGDDCYEMRQVRYAEAFQRGVEHAHDLCAVGFSGKQIRDLVERHRFDCDLSALPVEPTRIVLRAQAWPEGSVPLNSNTVKYLNVGGEK